MTCSRLDGPYSTQFFDEYGYVVVRDVLTSDECLATIDDIWTYLETGAFGGIDPGIKRDNPSTWTKGWPPMQKSGLALYVHIYLDLAVLTVGPTVEPGGFGVIFSN